MSYTELDEQRIYEAMSKAVRDELLAPSRMSQDQFLRHLARVVLEAMICPVCGDALADCTCRDVKAAMQREPLKEISAECQQCGGQWFWPIENGYELILATCHEHSDPPGREPLEDVLDDPRITGLYLDKGLDPEEPQTWDAEIHGGSGWRWFGEGATPHEAIRAAVAAANEGR